MNIWIALGLGCGLGVITTVGIIVASRYRPTPGSAGKVLAGCALAFVLLFVASWAVAGITNGVTIAMLVNVVCCSFGAVVNIRQSPTSKHNVRE